MTAALLGAVLGPALQLQQAQLWGWAAYAALIAFAAVLLGSLSRLRGSAGVRAVVLLLSFASIAFASCGLRAIHFASTSLNPQLEGRDITITGVVVAMYRMVVQHWPREKAIAELTDPRHGHHAEVFPNIREYLETVDLESIRRQVDR